MTWCVEQGPCDDGRYVPFGAGRDCDGCSIRFPNESLACMHQDQSRVLGTWLASNDVTPGGRAYAMRSAIIIIVNFFFFPLPNLTVDARLCMHGTEHAYQVPGRLYAPISTDSVRRANNVDLHNQVRENWCMGCWRHCEPH